MVLVIAAIATSMRGPDRNGEKSISLQAERDAQMRLRTARVVTHRLQ
jgi:hypothetical protein